jgi:hypothetical protein
MQFQSLIEELPSQLVEMKKKKLKNCQKSNHESMVSFKNSFNRQKQSWRQHFYQDEYDFKIKFFYDSSSLMDLNQQLKFDENE